MGLDAAVGVGTSAMLESRGRNSISYDMVALRAHWRAEGHQRRAGMHLPTGQVGREQRLVYPSLGQRDRFWAQE